MQYGRDIDLRLGAGVFLLTLALALGACNLEVTELPVNHPPVVGAIEILPGMALAPLDSFTLSVSAYDPDGDDLFITWSAGDVGTWVEGEDQDSVVTWVAPASFAGIDTVKFSVSIFDFNLSTAIVRRLDIAVEQQFGDLQVRVWDLADQPFPAPVRIAVAGVETTTVAASEHLFTDLLWGNQTVFTVESNDFHGAVLEGVNTFAGYPDTVYIRTGELVSLDIHVAPKTLLVVPGRPGAPVENMAPIYFIQAAIDTCQTLGIDTLLVKRGNYPLIAQDVPGGTAALRLDSADLTLAAFPGEGPIWLDAGPSGSDFGFFLDNRSSETRIENFAMVNAKLNGAVLRNSSGCFSETLLRNCGSAGIFMNGAPDDTLRLRGVEISINEHGLSASGGFIDAEGTLIEYSLSYGIWLRDLAAANLRRLTVVKSGNVGLFTNGSGSILLDSSILARNAKGLFRQADESITLSCNLFWDNSYGNSNAPIGATDITAEDPLFCDPALGDWRVDPSSPALTSDCAPIGAYSDCDSPISPFWEIMQ